MTFSLDKFNVSGDYRSGVELECEDCAYFQFHVGLGFGTSLSHLIELAENHLKEKHSGQSSR